MNKIDTVKWGNFKISDLFNLILAQGDLQAQKLEGGQFPLVSSGKVNNGICKYIEKQEVDLFEDGIITVDMFGKAFYQSNPFYAVSHGRVNMLLAKKKMSKEIGLFVSSIIEKTTLSKYSFNEMCSSKSLSNDAIKLPIHNIYALDFAKLQDIVGGGGGGC